jgi:MtN3 and saliva related transmembrane protein
MQIATALGLLAGTLTTISFLPQVIKTWQSKSAKDISLGMFVTFCIGVFFWLIYGILIGESPIVISNLVTLILSSSILWMKLVYDRRQR